MHLRRRFSSFDLPDTKFHALAKVRSSQQPTEVIVTPMANGIKVDFSEPQKALTPGQSVVLYNNDILLGGGIINQIG